MKAQVRKADPVSLASLLVEKVAVERAPHTLLIAVDDDSIFLRIQNFAEVNVPKFCVIPKDICLAAVQAKSSF